MIFLTVGSHEPFDRLVRAVDYWCGSRKSGDLVFGQITDRAHYRPSNYEFVTRLKPDEFMERCAEATVIVSHAGMGSIITAMQLETPILIMPRRAHLMESRSDHQLATAGRFGSRRGIYVAYDTKSLTTLMDRFLSGKEAAGPAGSAGAFADDHLLEAIRDFIQLGSSA